MQMLASLERTLENLSSEVRANRKESNAHLSRVEEDMVQMRRQVDDHSGRFSQSTSVDAQDTDAPSTVGFTVRFDKDDYEHLQAIAEEVAGKLNELVSPEDHWVTRDGMPSTQL